MLALLLSFVSIPQAVPVDTTTFQFTVGVADQAPLIDGVLGDDEWAGAPLLSDFLQYEPQRGAPASERTEVLVLQDDRALYVAFGVWDSQTPTAQITRRDASLTSDDMVGFTLDTYGDRQSAYLFITNLLSTQQDARIADDGRTIDTAWDAEWESAAAPTEFGWTAEFAIPFSSLRYEPGEDRVWGINFGRTLRRTLEFSFWAGPVDNPTRISQSGELRGLDLLRPPRPAEVIVYGLSRAADGQDADWDTGADLRFSPDPSVTMNATVNPDFATIEADREQVNLSRFEISLPEKRPFFLEGNELYRQRIQTFYSRRISDIRAVVGSWERRGRGRIPPWVWVASQATSVIPRSSEWEGSAATWAARTSEPLGPSDASMGRRTARWASMRRCSFRRPSGSLGRPFRATESSTTVRPCSSCAQPMTRRRAIFTCVTRISVTVSATTSTRSASCVTTTGASWTLWWRKRSGSRTVRWSGSGMTPTTTSIGVRTAPDAAGPSSKRSISSSAVAGRPRLRTTKSSSCSKRNFAIGPLPWGLATTPGSSRRRA